MEIRFVSSLTADDEDRIAPALLRAIATLLDQFPIAYTVRIETIAAKVYQQHSLPDLKAPTNGAEPAARDPKDALAAGIAGVADVASRAVRSRAPFDIAARLRPDSVI